MAHRPTDRDLQIAAERDAPKAFMPWEVLREPVQDGLFWVVTAEDQVLGVMERKKFRTHRQALDFYTSVLLGKAAVHERLDSLPESGRRSVDANTQATDLAKSGTAQFDPRGRHTDGINLKEVSEVLAGYGLDPIAEIAGILVPHDVVDADTGVESKGYQLDAKERVKALLELTQYVRPKLKAVEVTTKSGDLTDKQVDDRLKILLAKALQRDSVTA